MGFGVEVQDRELFAGPVLHSPRVEFCLGALRILCGSRGLPANGRAREGARANRVERAGPTLLAALQSPAVLSPTKISCRPQALHFACPSPHSFFSARESQRPQPQPCSPLESRLGASAPLPFLRASFRGDFFSSSDFTPAGQLTSHQQDEILSRDHGSSVLLQDR